MSRTLDDYALLLLRRSVMTRSLLGGKGQSRLCAARELSCSNDSSVVVVAIIDIFAASNWRCVNSLAVEKAPHNDASLLGVSKYYSDDDLNEKRCCYCWVKIRKRWRVCDEGLNRAAYIWDRCPDRSRILQNTRL